jgi:hypothetical protein
MCRTRPVRKPRLGRGDFWCLLVILGLATIFLTPALRSGYTLLPLGMASKIAPWDKQVTQDVKNSLLSDPFYTFYPRRHFLTTSLRQGSLPLWNPYIFSGQPVMGDTAAQTFYPPNLVAAVFLSAARALPILAWFHLTVTGFSMFAFLRLLRLGPIPALFGATAWMLNGNTVVWLENTHRLSTLAWMPAVFLFYELALQRHRVWPGVVAGLLYGLSILGGHTQLAFGLGIVLAAYALLRTATSSWSAHRLALRPLAIAVTVGLLGIGIGAVQLLPSYQLAGMSHRGLKSVSTYLEEHWPLQHVIGLWIPDFYGNPVRSPYWGERNYAQVTVYYGAFAFPLSLGAFVWTRQIEGKFFAVAQLLTALIALGTPLIWLVAWLPGFRYFRLVALVAYLPFFGSMAAAFGLEAASGSIRQRRVDWATLLVLAGLAIATAMIAQANYKKVADYWETIQPLLLRTGLIWSAGMVGLLLIRWKPVIVMSALVMLLAVDLLQWGMPFNPVNSLDILYPENEVTAQLRQDASMYRVLPLQADRPVFGPNTLSVFGFYAPGGYSSLMVERYRQLVQAIGDEAEIEWMRRNPNILANSRFDPLFSLLNVKYVLASDQLDQPLVSVDASLSGCVEPGLPLRAGERITQTFQAHHPGLNRIDVEFVRTDSADQPIRFLLWRDREDGDLVADISVEDAALHERDVLAFYFAPIPDSTGQVFVWGLETQGEEQVTVCQAEEGQPGHPAFQAYSVQLQLANIRQGVWIYENPNALPRAYIVHKAEVASGSALLERLVHPNFNVWTTALLEEPLPPEQAAALEMAPLRSNSQALITHYGLHEIEVEAEMAAAGLLVLSDTYYPGWQVAVDGAPAALLRTNYALRGVYLPEGVHQVVFRFIPWAFYVGLILTGLTLICGAGVVLWEMQCCVRRVAPESLPSRIEREDRIK